MRNQEKLLRYNALDSYRNPTQVGRKNILKAIGRIRVEELGNLTP